MSCRYILFSPSNTAYALSNSGERDSGSQSLSTLRLSSSSASVNSSCWIIRAVNVVKARYSGRYVLLFLPFMYSTTVMNRSSCQSLYFRELSSRK